MGVWSLVLWNMWSRAVQLHCQKAERQGGARDRIPVSDLLSPARPHMLEKVPQAVPPSGDQEFHTRACGEQHFTFGSSSLAPGPRIWHQRLLCCTGMRFWAQSKPVPRAEASRLEVLSSLLPLCGYPLLCPQVSHVEPELLAFLFSPFTSVCCESLVTGPTDHRACPKSSPTRSLTWSP